MTHQIFVSCFKGTQSFLTLLTQLFIFNQVVIPTAVSSGSVAKARLDDAAKGGLGSEGWKVIGSAQKGAKRY